MRLGLLLLFGGLRSVLALRGLRLSDLAIGVRLGGLQFGADVLADVDVGDVDRHNLERRSRIEPLREHGLRDAIRILQHFLVIDRRADRGNDAFADTRNDRLFACAADVAIEVASHRDTRFDVELNAVLGDALERRRLDDLRSDRGLERFDDVAPRKIDRCGTLPVERNLRALGGDHGERHVLHVASGEKVRLHLIHGEIQAGLARAHVVRDNDAGRYADQPHAHERNDAERHARSDGTNPGSDRKVIQKYEKENDRYDDDDHRTDGREFHAICAPLLITRKSNRLDEDARAFYPGDADGSARRDELALGEDVDAFSVDLRHTGRAQERRGNAGHAA